LLAGTLGGLLTTWVTFAPCFLWIFLGAPFIERLRDNTVLTAALGAITAAVVGVILNLAVWFGLHVVFSEVVEFSSFGLALDIPVLESINWFSALLVLAAMIAIFRFGLGPVTVLAGCAAAGVALHLAGGLTA
jgi:chromate transporter